MFRYTALGDSITAGLAATGPAFAYPSQAAAILRRQTGGCVTSVLAESGWTSTELNAAVFENPPGYVVGANAVSIWVGGDDLIQAAFRMLQTRQPNRNIQLVRTAITHYGIELARLVGAIHRISSARLVVCTQYNPFPNSEIASEAISMLNRATIVVAEQLGATIAPTDAWFAGRQAELIRGYRTGRIEDALRGTAPVHPNNRGHLVIAENLVPLLR